MASVLPNNRNPLTGVFRRPQAAVNPSTHTDDRVMEKEVIDNLMYDPLVLRLFPFEQQIMQVIQEKQKQLANLEIKASENEESINAMNEYMKNVQQERSHTRALCRAVEKKNESELHFKALDEREMGRLRQEFTQQQNKLTLLQEKNSLENYIFKATQKMDKLKAQLNWDQHTLNAWLEESAHEDEDTMVIAKYALQDERTINELTLRIDKLTLESQQKRKASDNEDTETIVAQVALEKTVEMVQQANVERQELISRWENSIEQMRKKDQNLQQCALLFTDIYKVLSENKARIKENLDILADMAKNNKDCEKKTSAVECLADRLRQQFQKEESNQTQLQNELVSLKGRLDRTGVILESKMSHLASINKDIDAKTAKIEEVQQHKTALEEKLQAITEQALSMEERVTQMEQMHQNQEKQLKELDNQIQREQKLLLKKKEELKTRQGKEKNILADISGSRAALSDVDKNLHKLDQSAFKQQEYINSQEFQFLCLEVKIARLSGNVNKDEKKALEKQVSEVNKALEEKKKAVAFISAQLKKLQDDLRYVRKMNEKTEAEKRDLTTKTEELKLSIVNMEKELKNLCLNKQDSLVDRNVLKLEVKRLRTLLYKKADGVLTLEKRKLQLETAMKERQEEIFVQQEMDNKQLKFTEREIQGVRDQLQERLSKVDKMKTKYEVITISMAAPEGKEENVPIYYLIKACQEKEELQCKCDDLHAKVCKTEKETKALENTMYLFNDQYNKSFSKVIESSQEYQEKLKLEEQKKAADEKDKFQRHQIRELEESMELTRSTMNNLQQTELAQTKRKAELNDQIVSLNKAHISQQEKLDRATKQSSKLIKEIRSVKNTTGKTFEECDMNLKELKNCKKETNKRLLEAMEQDPDLQAKVEMSCMQAGLALPSPASTPSSRISTVSSARSSVSLRSSRSSVSHSTRGSATPLLSVNTVELSLEISVAPECLHQSPGSASSRSSVTSRSSHLK